MASRPLIKPFPVIVNASMATSVISLVTFCDQLSMIGYTVICTGAPVGTLTVEVCNDAQFESNGVYIAGTGTWIPLYFNVAGVPANSIIVSGPTNAFIDIDAIAAANIRLHYNATSGTGTINAFLSGKVS